MVTGISGQDQKLADSFALIYQQNILTGTAKLELLRNLSFNETSDLTKGLKYAEELISLSELAADNIYLRRGYFLKGTKERLLGHLEEALHAFLQSAEVARKSHNVRAEAEAYSAIADSYAVANNPATAKPYYNKAISTLEQATPKAKEDSINLASVLSNAGDLFLRIKNYDSAFFYFNSAKIIFDNVNYQSGQGYSLGNIGMVYANLGKSDLAEKNINQAVNILAQAQDYYPICTYLLSMAEIYSDKGNGPAALNYASRSFRLAEQYRLKEQIADASLNLSQ